MDFTFTTKELVQLNKHNVVAVYVFGSRAQGLAGPLSDYDFAILTKKGYEKRGDDVYQALYDVLSPHCPRTMKNDVIDIVFLNRVPLELRFHVIRYGQVLFEDDTKARLNFEDKTQREYSDFRPILDSFDHAILASL